MKTATGRARGEMTIRVLAALIFLLLLHTTQISASSAREYLSEYHLNFADTPLYSWSEKELIYLANRVHHLPYRLKTFLKQEKFTFTKRSQPIPIKTDIIEDLSNLEAGEIPIYSQKEWESIQPSELNEIERENYNFLKSNQILYFQSDKTDETSLSNLTREVLRKILLDFNRPRKISQSSNWMRFSGWNGDAENQSVYGYAHPVGLISPEEDFASFAARFIEPTVTLYENTIKCLTPDKYDFLQSVFPDFQTYLNHPDFKQQGIVCPDLNSDFAHNVRFKDIHTGEIIHLGPINDKTVEGFELFYATPGDKEISEIAGHLLLRMKLNNNPYAKSAGIENPYDLTIAILADTSLPQQKSKPEKERLLPVVCETPQDHENDTEIGLDTIIQALKGLTGGLRTIFQIDTLQYSIYHYTQMSNRSLIRYKLNLTESQKKALIRKLYYSQKNYKTPYYFFHKNCGSILIRLIGEALNEQDLMKYNVLASPPNSLLAILKEKKLITPVFPKFHSFTSEAQIAQDLIKQELVLLKTAYPYIKWPESTLFFEDDETIRTAAYKQLTSITNQHPESMQGIITILKLSQKAELIFTWKEDECLEFSTPVKKQTRQELRYLMSNPTSATPIDLERWIQNTETLEEQKDNQLGSNHTRLMSFKTGVGVHHYGPSDDRSYFLIGGSIYRQDAGDLSNLTMQFGTNVKLGTLNLEYSIEDDQYILGRFDLIGLEIDKIKERRHHIPDIVDADRKLGMGFTLLDMKKRSYPFDLSSTILVEGRIFTNIVSSRNNMNHISIATGFGIESFWNNDSLVEKRIYNHQTALLRNPWTLKSQLTLGENHSAQLQFTLNQTNFFPINTNFYTENLFKQNEYTLNILYIIQGLFSSDLIITGKWQRTVKENDYLKSDVSWNTLEMGVELARW